MPRRSLRCLGCSQSGISTHRTRPRPHLAPRPRGPVAPRPRVGAGPTERAVAPVDTATATSDRLLRCRSSSVVVVVVVWWSSWWWLWCVLCPDQLGGFSCRSVRKCKEHLDLMFMPKRSLHFRTNNMVSSSSEVHATPRCLLLMGLYISGQITSPPQAPAGAFLGIEF